MTFGDFYGQIIVLTKRYIATTDTFTAVLLDYHQMGNKWRKSYKIYSAVMFLMSTTENMKSMFAFFNAL